MRIENLQDMLRYVDLHFRERDRQIKDLVAHINKNSRPQPMQPDLEKLQDGWIKRVLDYNQVIIVLGFGGFLALWASISQRVPPLVFGICGALLVFSLLSYILPQLLSTWDMILLAREVQGKGLAERTAAEEAYNARLIRRGPTVFLLSAVPGVTGGAILLGTFFVLSLQAVGFE